MFNLTQSSRISSKSVNPNCECRVGLRGVLSGQKHWRIDTVQGRGKPPHPWQYPDLCAPVTPHSGNVAKMTPHHHPRLGN